MKDQWLELSEPYDLEKNGDQFGVKADGRNLFFKVLEVKGNKVRVEEVKDSESWAHLVDLGGNDG